MNIRTLLDRLHENNIRPDAYDLDGHDGNESYVLKKEHLGWDVYYSERGLKTGLKKFGTESSACAYLLQVLLDDPNARRRDDLRER